MDFEGSNKGLQPEDKLECGICWWVYDPEMGDDTRNIAPGTAFADLPADWHCPGCDAPQRKFMKMAE